MGSATASNKLLGWALVSAFAMRLAWSLVVPIEPVSDSAAYHEFASSIASGRGYAYADGALTAYWPVGTSALYAVVYLVFGQSLQWIEVLNILLGVALVWLTYRLGTLWFSPAVGSIAALVMSVWPMLIQFTTVLASELPFAVLLLASLVQFFAPGRRWPRVALAGVFLAVACLMRPTAIILVVVLPALAALRGTRLVGALMQACILLLAVAAVISPWALRNTELYSAPVLISTNFGPNLWMGNNPESTGAYMPLPQSRTFENELQRDRELRAEAIGHIRSDPFHYLVVMSFKRFLITHDRETIGVVWNERGLHSAGLSGLVSPLKLLSSAYWWLVAVLSLAGAWTLVRGGWRQSLHPTIVIGLIFIAIPTLTVGQDRYHFPVIPFVAILAALFVARLRYGRGWVSKQSEGSR